MTTGVSEDEEEKDKVYPRQKFSLGKKSVSALESGGLSALAGSMQAYSKKIEDDDSESATKFHEATATLEGNEGRAWALLYELKEGSPQLYKDFIAWAGLDAQARPQVGEALVTYVPGGMASEKITRNLKAYQALVNVLKKILEKADESSGSLLEAVLNIAKSISGESTRQIETLPADIALLQSFEAEPEIFFKYQAPKIDLQQAVKNLLQ